MLSHRLLTGALLAGLVGCVEGPEPTAEAAPAPRPAFTEQGKASFYGPGFHGEIAASGERFDQNRLVAAHPSLPFGTRVRVTNLDNDKAVTVRIVDRGPFKEGRVIDLSQAAARRLDLLEDGITVVRLETVEGD